VGGVRGGEFLDSGVSRGWCLKLGEMVYEEVLPLKVWTNLERGGVCLELGEMVCEKVLPLDSLDRGKGRGKVFVSGRRSSIRNT